MDHLHNPEPIATCLNTSCAECNLQGQLHCHFSRFNFVKFMLAVLPSLLIGALAIRLISNGLLILWVVLCLGFFGFVEIRVLCSHCPHYAETGKFLRCWANRGSPKFWKYRPGPLSLIEKIILLTGFSIIWGYPLVFLIIGREWLMLLGFALTSIGFYAILKLKFCSQCMNFACPLNSIADNVREQFLELNPGVATGWKKSSTQ